MRLSRDKILRVLATAAVLVICDLVTKYWISRSFFRGESKVLIPGLLNFTLVHNTGAAFGLGRNWSMPFFVITSVIAIAVIVQLLLKLDPKEKLSFWGLTLILGGAFGNLIDRLRLGYVVDFVDVYYKTHHWPAFNVADSAISIGFVLFGLEFLVKKSSKESAPE